VEGGEDVAAQHRTTFAADVSLLASLRDFAVDAADSLGATIDRADLVVVVGELVANAAIHQHAEATLGVTARPDGGLLIEVADGDPGVPSMVDGEAAGIRGHRGMFLIDALSEAWGVEPSPDGKRVWAILPPASRRPAADRGVSSRRSAQPG
jgi:anti-sigma regulatory factor (Ser/Thr protein kinase)